jgi:enoyl-CoA hydratase/carnithine racemase
VSEPFPIRIAQRGLVSVWTIDRPERMNAISRDALFSLGRLARDAQRNDSIRAVVITGAGEKAFCAGADLKERPELSDDDVRALLDAYRSELGWIDQSSKPMVAAINGVALGGGLELALCCDLRVAASHARFGMPETSLAVIPGAGGTQRLPRLIGEGRAKEMILLGRSISANEAIAWGLVNRITPVGVSVVDDAIEWIGPIAQGAPIAQAAALESLDRAFDVPLDVGIRLEKMSYERTLSSDDRRAALAGLSDKRKPEFRGK